MNEIWMNEIVGISGSVLIAISMVFKTTTDKGVMYLRIFNLLGSIVFVVYGFMLPAYSTIVLNCICVVLNIIGLVKIIQKIRKERHKQLIIFVVYKYEIRLSVVLAQNGFSCDAVYHDGIDVNILNNPWRVLDGGVPFLKKQSFNYNDNVLSLYQFLSNDWLSEVFAYTKTYGIWETNTGSDSVYKKVFRMSLFGIPIVTLRRKRNQWKAYLFDFIPVMKISL